MEKSCIGSNYGGIYRLWIAFCQTPQNFEEINFLSETADYNYKKIRSERGRFFEHSLSFKIPKFDDTLNRFLDKSQRCCGVIVKFETNNLDTLIIGSEKMPLKLDYDFKAGEQIKNLQHYSIIVSGQTLKLYEQYAKP